MSSNRNEEDSFWSMIRGKRALDFLESDSDEAESKRRRIEERRVVGSKLAYGVGYEWITEPMSISSVRGPDWADMDKFFKGVPIEELEKASAKKKKDEQWFRPGDLMEVMTFPDDGYFAAAAGGWPTLQKMVGTYDIIYYAAEYEYEMQHHRTARGTLELTSVASSGGGSVLQGSIQMHPSMEKLDVVPYGGNFSFVETNRIHRANRALMEQDWTQGAYLPVADDERVTETAAVIKIKVTDPPNGIFESKYGLSSDEPGYCKNEFKGELRMFAKKTATGLQLDGKEYSDTMEASMYKCDTLEAAKEMTKSQAESTCSWINAHTILPYAISRKIGEYVRPPPFFFFEEGDLCIDIDWDGGLPDHWAFSCIVARRAAKK